MTQNRKYHIFAVLCTILAMSIGLTAFIGIFFRGEMAVTEVTNMRGETYRAISTGIYRFNSERMVAEGIGWDIFTLFIAVPALLVLVPFLWRGSFRARLLGTGILAYFFYQYLMYCIGWAFGPLFPVFIALYSVSLFFALWLALTIDVTNLDRRFRSTFPKSGVIVLCIAIAAILLVMWLQRIVAGVNGDWSKAMLLGQTTMVVQALDLGLVVPLALLTAFLVWRNRPAGFILSSVFLVKGVAMSGAICVMLVSAWLIEGKFPIGPLLVFGMVFAATTYLGSRIIRSC